MIQGQARVFLLAFVVLATIIPVAVFSHGGDDRSSFPSRGGPKEVSPDPEDDTTIVSDAWFGDYNNELPEQVDHYLEKVEAQRRVLGPDAGIELDVRVARLRLRRTIAQKRQERDVLRKGKDQERAAKLDSEIHALKVQFKNAGMKDASLTTAAHAQESDEHAH